LRPVYKRRLENQRPRARKNVLQKDKRRESSMPISPYDANAENNLRSEAFLLDCATFRKGVSVKKKGRGDRSEIDVSD